jgi:Raf kinase inhibitor-like YbhB/YbcL family protein
MWCRFYDARMRACAAIVAVSIGVAAAGCGGNDTVSSSAPRVPAKLTLASPAFKDGTTLPKEFTCDGEGVSPPLVWFQIPKGTQELALIVEDPDAPGGTFVHWTLWGITPKATGLQQNAPTSGLQQGKNGFGKTGWGAPCPPKGDKPHRYQFTLYALSQPLDLGEGASGDDVHAALATAATAEGTIVGRYARR